MAFKDTLDLRYLTHFIFLHTVGPQIELPQAEQASQLRAHLSMGAVGVHEPVYLWDTTIRILFL